MAISGPTAISGRCMDVFSIVWEKALTEVLIYEVARAVPGAVASEPSSSSKPADPASRQARAEPDLLFNSSLKSSDEALCCVEKYIKKQSTDIGPDKSR